MLLFRSISCQQGEYAAGRSDWERFQILDFRLFDCLIGRIIQFPIPNSNSQLSTILDAEAASIAARSPF
ncbi:MAG: hypothetical protein HC849_09115 [Oscillatoriales cyanobacterium RU_3_3]|nr:hypothetical protein [Microcoleus sp. SU_5_6]NJL67577.1 hypothetical protein [Microcoleus sp. SM1_3_4]NJM60303.1 hypothetical protein [Oscillatoriales cyanobacterium RU_3_3]